jgi:hypothetical protein
MNNQSESESAISHNRDSAASNDSSQLDFAGQAILKLLHKAAGVAEANSRHALETAQKLSGQLREAENRIGELEAEVQLYREKAERAERWLHKISTEIEERLIWKSEEERRRMSRRL